MKKKTSRVYLFENEWKCHYIALFFEFSLGNGNSYQKTTEAKYVGNGSFHEMRQI